MTEAWIQTPRMRSDTQKKAFLSDLVNKSKTIGIQNTVDIMLPCLINAFNSDSCIHPDVYENHAHLLFNNLTELIHFLAKKSQKNKKKDKEPKQKTSKKRASKEIYEPVSQLDSKVGDNWEVASGNSSDTDESEFDFSDLSLSNIDPNYGLNAITSVLLP